MKTNHSLQQFLSVAALSLLLLVGGCAPQPLKVDQTFWSKPGQRIGLALTVPAKANASRAGAQGLLDQAINSAMAGSLEAHLATVNITALNNIVYAVSDSLKKRGQTPVVLGLVTPGALQPFKTEGSNKDYGSKDLRPAGKDKQLDAILLVEVTAVGTLRSYYGFVPISAPAGYVAADSQMVDARSNKLIWRALNTQAQPVVGEWDTPPAYANVDQAIATAIAAMPALIAADLMSP